MRLGPWLPAAMLAVACSEPAITTPVDHLSSEVLDPAGRLPKELITARVYGSFRVNTASGAITGVANFPGHPPAGPGTCKEGLWINSQGKPTTGNSTKPHPHCISDAVEVVLEPISACFSDYLVPMLDPKGNPTIGSKCPTKITTEVKHYRLTVAPGPSFVEGFTYTDPSVAGSTFTGGKTTLQAYAIDGATLNDPLTPPRRVGILTIDLNQYVRQGTNYFDPAGTDACDLDSSLNAPCLNRVISASYTPLPEGSGGVGSPDSSVEGFLWFTPATEPYNYDAVPPR